MAWNGSNGKNTNSTSAVKRPVGREGKRPSIMRGAFAALAVIALAAIAFFAVRFAIKNDNGGEKPVNAKSTKKDRPINQAGPVASPKIETPVAGDEKVPEHRKGEIWHSADGKKMITLEKDGVLKDVEVYVPKNRPTSKTRIFQHKSENAIANLMHVAPGTPTFGRTNYAGYQEDFLKSCTVPIVIEEGDDEFTRQLKKDVREMKIVLKERIDAGESLDVILTEAREELKKLAAVKKAIEGQLRKEAAREGTTERDLAILRDAANKMLEDRGIPPIRANSIVDYHLRKLQREGEQRQ